MLVRGDRFFVLSKENPALYKSALNYYVKAKKRRESYKIIKNTIESKVADKLKLSNRLVFWHKYKPIIWSSDNIWFKELNKDEGLWLLKWEASEGEQSKETKIEIYYSTLE